jgi:hypothetical protein
MGPPLVFDRVVDLDGRALPVSVLDRTVKHGEGEVKVLAWREFDGDFLSLTLVHCTRQRIR